MAQKIPQQRFSLFDSYDYGTAAPELYPSYYPDTKETHPQRKKKPVAKKQTKVTLAQKRATYVSFVNTAKVLAWLTAFFSVVCVAIFLNVTLDEKATKIADIENSIKIEQSDQVRLASALEGKVSVDKIRDYAVNTLGMVKLENYRVTYFESEEENHVVISGGKKYLTNQKTAGDE